MTPAELSDATALASGTQPKNYGKLRARLAGKTGPAYWRSLDEATGSVEFNEFVHEEFPASVGEILDPVSRRNFFKVMGASMMLAGLASCARQPEEHIVPYVNMPENMTPGRPVYYTTAMTLHGYGLGLVATSYEGRPTKLEGLPNHPSSMGATDIFAQASILDMYDPGRLDAVLHAGVISTYNRFVSDITSMLTGFDATGGEGMRILTQSVTSPTFRWQMNRILAQYPNAVWHQYEACNRDNVRNGAIMAFGAPVDTIYDFSKARVVVSLDSNFLCEGVGGVRYSLDYAYSRDVENNGGTMSRFYAAESSPTLTGSNADHKINLRYPEIEQLARTIAQRLGVATAPAGGVTLPDPWVNAVVEDLQANGANSVVVVGDNQPAIVHALAHAINGAIGSTLVQHIDPVEIEPTEQIANLRQLTQDMNDGNVRLLLIMGGNPSYDAPADINFAAALDKVEQRVHLTPSANETSFNCHWVIPQTHFLEEWSDVRAHDGTVSIVQPLIQPLYGGKSCHDLLAVLLGESTMTGRDIVRAAWQAERGTDNFEVFWRTALSTGIVPDTTLTASARSVSGQLPAATEINARQGLDVLFRPDPMILDGRFANNGWLQELPKPLNKLTWDNAVYIAPTTAKALDLAHEDLVELTVGERSVTAPVFYQFGHPKDAITVHLGYGRERVGAIGKARGFNAYKIQTSSSPWFATGASLRRTGKRYGLATTTEHWHIEQSTVDQGEISERRHLIKEGTLHDFQEHPDFAKHLGHPTPEQDFTLYNPEEMPHQKWQEGIPAPYISVGENERASKYQWGMTIDLNRCTGCGVCTIACQAENNIPVVGKDQVAMQREMHWIRVDRYYRGDYYGEPEVVHQPVPCMHCENAPCEPVCPVGATTHSAEGLNDMTYNRCIGTRYCGNNCPYKVRRFNFFHWQINNGQDAASLKMMRNPNVTVRSRGVMEKCTYCVQRINRARIDAKVRAAKSGNAQDEFIRDGEVVTACQAACPSRAIVFGDLRTQDSAVNREKAKSRNYGLIADIGTRPRTSYLAKLRNPHHSLGPETLLHDMHHAGHGTEEAAHGGGTHAEDAPHSSEQH